MKRKILVRGPALSQTGYGEQTRFALRALRKREDIFDIYIINTDWGKSNWIWANTDERQWIDQMISKTTTLPRENPMLDMSLQVTIPNEWEKMSPYDIGYTAGVETTKVSKNWINKSNEMQKIVFVSSFAEQIFNKTVYYEEQSKKYIKNNTPTSLSLNLSIMVLETLIQKKLMLILLMILIFLLYASGVQEKI